MSDFHDESECEGLHEITSFSIRAYSLSKGSNELKSWFDKVLKVQQPSVYGAYSVDFTTAPSQDGSTEDVVEVMAHIPNVLSIDALEALFFCYRDDQEALTKKSNESTKGLN